MRHSWKWGNRVNSVLSDSRIRRGIIDECRVGRVIARNDVVAKRVYAGLVSPIL